MSIFELGEKIRNRRKYLGKNQEVIANKVPVSKSQISKWENENTYPSMSDFVKLCRAMNIHPVDLIAGRIEENWLNHKEKKIKTVFAGVLAVVILCLGVNLYVTICRLKGIEPPRQYEINYLYKRMSKDGEVDVRRLIRQAEENVWVDIVTHEKDGIILDYILKEIIVLKDDMQTEHKVQLDEDGKRLIVYVYYLAENHPQVTFVEIKPQK